MSAPKCRLVVVVGTGTDVGKTHVTAALARCLRLRGARVGAWKPIASGLDEGGGDGGVLARALDEAYDPPAYAFVDPISPHLAAANAGVTIDLARVREGALERASHCALLFVESAGGLFSPVAPRTTSDRPGPLTNADLTLALTPATTLLVAPDRLGVLHDVSATLLAARSGGVRIDALVLSAPATPDASTGTNARELASLGIFDVCATFPRAPLDDEGTLLAASRVLAAIG